MFSRSRMRKSMAISRTAPQTTGKPINSRCHGNKICRKELPSTMTALSQPEWKVKSFRGIGEGLASSPAYKIMRSQN